MLSGLFPTHPLCSCLLGFCSLVAQFCSWHLLCLPFPCRLLLHSFLKRKELEFPSTPSIPASTLSLPFLTKFLVTCQPHVQASPLLIDFHPTPSVSCCAGLGPAAPQAERTQAKGHISAFSFHDLERIDHFLLGFHWDTSLVGFITLLGHSFSTSFAGSFLYQ